MTSRYTRSKAHRPSTPALEESDVEPDDVAPVADTHSVSETTASIVYIRYKCKKLNSFKHLVRTTVAGSHN